MRLYNSLCLSVCRSVAPSQVAKSTMLFVSLTKTQPRLNDKSGNKQNSISVIVIVIIIVVLKATLSSLRRRQVVVVKYN